MLIAQKLGLISAGLCLKTHPIQQPSFCSYIEDNELNNFFFPKLLYMCCIDYCFQNYSISIINALCQQYHFINQN